MYRNLLPGLQEHSGEVEHTAHLFVKFVSHFYTVATCSGYYARESFIVVQYIDTN